MQLFQDGQSLLLGAVLQNPLDDSAAIRVCGEHKHLKNNKKKKVEDCRGGATLCYSHFFNENKSPLSYLSFKGVDNELKGLRLDALDALLYHVVSILVLHALQNVAVELADNVALECIKEVGRHYHFAKVDEDISCDAVIAETIKTN